MRTQAENIENDLKEALDDFDLALQNLNEVCVLYSNTIEYQMLESAYDADLLKKKLKEKAISTINYEIGGDDNDI